MKGRQKRAGALLAAALFAVLCLPCGIAEARMEATSAVSHSVRTVPVTLPEFEIRLNGMKVDNKYSQYPMLLYENMLYYPMTYYGSRYLGVETTYSVEEGVGVYQNGVRWDWHTYRRYLPNGKSDTAVVQENPLRVNNVLIDSSQDAYPVLLYRDITYFPLTEQYAVDAFGWNCQYSTQNGLAIQSPGAVAAQEIGLPMKTYADGAGAFLKVGAYYYYEGLHGEILQASVEDTSRGRRVYQLPTQQNPTSAERYCRPTLRIENNTVLLIYTQQHQNETRNHYIQIMPDGKWHELYQGKGQIHCFEDLMVLREPIENMGRYTVRVKTPLEKTFTSLHDAASSTAFYSTGDTVLEAGKELLMLGALGDVRDGEAEQYLLAVNSKNARVRQLTEDTVTCFAVENDTVYYLNDAQQLYRLPLTGGTSELVCDVPVSQFEVLDDTICYAHGCTGELHVLGSDELLNPGGIVASMEVQEDFFVIHFAENSQSAYTTMILSRKGKVLFKTTEHTAGMMIEDGKVSFVKLKA